MTPARRRAVLGAVALLLLLVVGLALTRYGSVSADPSPTTGQPSSTRAPTTRAPTTRDQSSGLTTVPLADLPSQARSTVALVQRGGPYPYPGKDGSTYNNSNGVLPRQARGFYREYTVTTPGSSDRGARRIVTGGRGSAVQFFYTADHYDSFVLVSLR